MNIGKILGGVLRTAAGLVGINLSSEEGGILKKASEIVDRIKDTPEMRAAVLTHEEEMKKLAIEEMRVANEESLAMIASSDNFTRRARPTGLYVFYAASIALIVAHILGVKLDSNFVWSVLAPLGGTGGLYIWKRTQEKTQ